MKLSYSKITWLIVWTFIGQGIQACQQKSPSDPTPAQCTSAGSRSVGEQERKLESAMQVGKTQSTEQPAHSSGPSVTEPLQLLEAIIEKQYAECLICGDSHPMNKLQYVYCDQKKLMCRECILRLNAPTCPYCREDLVAVPHINAMQAPKLTEQQTQQLQGLERIYPYIAQIIKRNQARQESVQLRPLLQRALSLPILPFFPGGLPILSEGEKKFYIYLASFAAGMLLLTFILGPVLQIIK